jgi:two-component system chemotaxis response regulator CheB
MINVLVVEDSRSTREFLVHVLEADPQIRVIDTAADGEEALASVSAHRPDVILMDIHLPGIDGFEATRQIMSSHPVPIVVCTAGTDANEVQTAMRALEAGALAALKKPGGLADPGARADAAALIRTLKLMSEVRVVRRWARKETAPARAASADPRPARREGVAIVAIGASTGGPPAIAQILSALPHSFPAPILIVQHISAGFVTGFAEWLSSASGLPVNVARGGQTALPGHVYLAPDDHHLRVGLHDELQTTRDEPLNGLRPSAGVLFRSVADGFGRRAVGVLLSGMGRDGAAELKLMADRGALTIAQDEESCVVFGMPAEAIRLGAAMQVLPPKKIAAVLSALAKSEGRGSR